MNKEELLEEEVTASLVDGYLPCAVAFKAARKLQVTPGVVGDVVDRLGIRIINCQLGCFIVEKAVHDDLDSKIVRENVMERVKSSLVDGRLPCAAAFAAGKELRASLKEVGDAANKLKVKIVDCQLGCFA